MTDKNRAASRLDRRQLIGGAAGAVTAAAVAKPRWAGAAPATIRQENVTLEVWGGVPEENGPGDLIAAFQEANPTISVNYTRYVNDDTGNTQLDTALQGGTTIDVYFTYAIPRLGQRIRAGAALDLTTYIDSDPAVKEWTTSTEGLFYYEDKLYALPTTVEPNFIFINQRLLDEAGIAVPESWTISEFQAIAEQLSSDMVFGAYAPPDTARIKLGPNYWYKEGGNESNFDHPAFREQLELHRGMIDAGTAFPWVDVLAQDLRAYAQTPFLTEQVGLWATSSFSLRYVNDLEQYPHDFITTFAPIPIPEGTENPYNPGGINNWIMMNSTTEHPDAAWTFMRFWLTDGAVHMLKGGKIPAFPGTDEQVIVEGILGPDRESLYDVEAYRRTVFAPNTRLVTDTITRGAAEITQIWQQQSDRYLIGEISIDECLAELKEQADTAIQNAAT